MICRIFTIFFTVAVYLVAAERSIFISNGVHLKMTPTEPIIWTIDCGDATEIDNNFLCFDHKPNTTIKHIRLIGKNLRKIGDNFLARCQGVICVEFESLQNVTVIGDNFLSHCTNLKQIDLSALTHVQKIGKRFLTACTSLTYINLKGLKHLRKIDDCFLSFCLSLTTLELSALENVCSVGNDFLYGTYRLNNKRSLKYQFLKNLRHNFEKFKLIEYFGHHLL
ncbi:MAG: hypothetical protein CNLJKLNK_01326 [Holosporales bacterium]